MHNAPIHKTWLKLALLTQSFSAIHAAERPAAPALALNIEAQEEVYTFEPANNGAGPLWCSGSTCLVRIGNDVFASGLETLKGIKPLNNCRWMLFRRGSDGWKLEQADARDRTREPCPLAGFPGGPLFLSVNPTLTTNEVYAGPARPEVLQFGGPSSREALTSSANSHSLDPTALKTTPARLLPLWQGTPSFTEHSYRSFAADGPARELILFQNIDYTHAEWSFRDKTGAWSTQGRLVWPQGSEYPKPEPIRVCYPDVALKNRAVHFCGVSDIVEPYPDWRVFKKQLTGQEWDYDFRRLFYTWCPDITHSNFQAWVEIASRDKTCGWVSPGDLWIDAAGAAHIVWTERALDERLRAKFFPEAKQSHSLNYAVLREGKVVLRRTLLLAEEGKSGLIAASPRFQATPDNRLFLICFVQGIDAGGKSVSENRLMEIKADGDTSSPVPLRLNPPFTSFFTATPRAGSPPSLTLELLGIRAGAPQTISYARVKLW